MINILWVGLSAKFSKDRSTLLPFDETTLSGKLLKEIELKLNTFNFTKTNLVSYPPLDSNNKLRYPTISECDQEVSRFLLDLENNQPKIVFMLGSKVSQYLIKKLELNLIEDSIYTLNTIYFISIEHPSYIMVYKRKYKLDYIKKINYHIQNLT